MNLQTLELTKLIRYSILQMTTKAGSGHPSSSLSAVELMTTLFFEGYYQFATDNPNYLFNDRLVFSKGHASPLFYALYHAAGTISTAELMEYRMFNSVLEGHPTPRFKYTEASTGSLGQGLSVGIGLALGIQMHVKNLQKMLNDRSVVQSSNVTNIGGQGQGRMATQISGMAKANEMIRRVPKVWVLLGDSEMAEGQVWEAIQIAGHSKINNLVGIIDVNRLGQRGETMDAWDIETYRQRISSFGWNALVIPDGHSLDMIHQTFETVEGKNPLQMYDPSKPTMIIAKTIKGRGVPAIEDQDNWHGKPLTQEMLNDALMEMGQINTEARGIIAVPQLVVEPSYAPPSGLLGIRTPEFAEGATVATREMYGKALVEMGKIDPRLVVLDAETSNSTYSEEFKKEFPDRFFEMFIAEQNMVSVAVGLSKMNFVPFVSSFAAFLSRSFDQIRMAQYSEANIKIAGSHAGVSIGYDGASQMALEDLGMMKSILNSTVLYPSDPVSAFKLLKKMHIQQNISYIRLTREKTPVLYNVHEEFVIGGSKVVQSSDQDSVTVIASGITVHEAVKASAILKEKGISIAIIDAYSIKPIDKKTITEYSQKTRKVIVVEDHYPYGGLGDSVTSALSGLPIHIHHLCARQIPRSGSPQELLEMEEIDAQAIIEAVRNIRI